MKSRLPFLLAAVVTAALSLTGCRVTVTSPADMSFDLSWRAGSRDADGSLMSGTEIMHLTSHDGKLYAATSAWMESEYDVPRSAQVLVLDSPTAQWRVDYQFKNNNLRLTSLQSITVSTDGQGGAVGPVSLLLAAPDVYAGDVAVYSRDDRSGAWVPMVLGNALKYTTTGALGLHRDTVTGVDMIFAGTDTLGTIAGVYDPDATGKILWHATAEFQTPANERVMGFADCNGVFYASTSRHIYQRTDGFQPEWKEVYYIPRETSAAGIRGLTAVPNPAGEGRVLLFAALNKVRTVDPANDFRETTELDMAAYLASLWNIQVAGVLSAYNEFMPYTLPGTNETVWLFGFESSYPAHVVQANPQMRLFVREDARWYFAAEARYFVRRVSNGKVSYEVGEIKDADKPTLVSVRTIRVSPFPGDEGDVLYFGGFDCNSQPSHNTGWIYRGTLIGK